MLGSLRRSDIDQSGTVAHNSLSIYHLHEPNDGNA